METEAVAEVLGGRKVLHKVIKKLGDLEPYCALLMQPGEKWSRPDRCRWTRCVLR
jgi:hypothetical protein